MSLSDLSIRRPVFATVVSLLLVVLGVIAYSRLTLRELPAIDPPVVSVGVDYPGASAAVVETRVTQILEDALSGIEGIETIESQSMQWRERHRHRVLAFTRHRGRGERRSRRREPGPRPPAARGGPAGDREGGIGL